MSGISQEIERGEEPEGRADVGIQPTRAARAKKKPRAVGTSILRVEAGFRECLHVHAEQAQLKWPSDGAASVLTSDGIYVAGPVHAVWIPVGVRHAGVYPAAVHERNVYVHRDFCQGLPERCCLVPLSPRLRHAIRAETEEDTNDLHRSSTEDLALLALLRDDVADSGRRALGLSLPERSRLQVLFDRLWSHPDDEQSVPAWARRVGMAERSLLRAFRSETGLSFREWRKRVRVHRALLLLNSGCEVGHVARTLGYASTSAFVAMFRATLGVTPARYFDPHGPAAGRVGRAKLSSARAASPKAR